MFTFTMSLVLCQHVCFYGFVVTNKGRVKLSCIFHVDAALCTEPHDIITEPQINHMSSLLCRPLVRITLNLLSE